MNEILIGSIIGILIGAFLTFLIIKLLKKKEIPTIPEPIQPQNNNEEVLKAKIEIFNQKIENLNLQLSEQKNAFQNEKETILRESSDQMKQKEADLKSQEKKIREESIKKSKSVMLGKMWEQIVPHYRPTDFTFTPSDARFLGSPVDFVIFDGASESDIEGVIFLEIKTATSKLSSQQTKLKKLIDSLNSEKVRWETINIPIELDKSEDITEPKNELINE